MTWGAPPNRTVYYEFINKEFELNRNKTLSALHSNGFKIQEDTGYTITAEKLLSLSFFSFFAFSKPRISLLILITKKKGKLTIKATYDYNSEFGIPLHDRGKLSISLNEIITSISSPTNSSSMTNNHTYESNSFFHTVRTEEIIEEND